MALDFNKFAAKGNEFIKHLATELDYPDDTARAGRVLRAVLHALRDQLTLEESVQLIAQFPMFLKAVYVQSWNPHKEHKRIRRLEEFYNEIRRIDKQTARFDFHKDKDIEKAIRVVFQVLQKYVSTGELKDIKAVLPKDLKPIVNLITIT